MSTPTEPTTKETKETKYSKPTEPKTTNPNIEEVKQKPSSFVPPSNVTPISVVENKKEKIVEPIEPIEIAEQKKVLFQFDRDTTVIADVIKQRDDNVIDLKTTVDFTGAFKTNISTGSSEHVFKRVQKGSKFEIGTWREIETVEVDN